MRFADVVPDRWREPGPHPVISPGNHKCGGWHKHDHATVQGFYDRLPYVSLEAALLHVVEHPGWRLRPYGGMWRCEP